PRGPLPRHHRMGHRPRRRTRATHALDRRREARTPPRRRSPDARGRPDARPRTRSHRTPHLRRMQGHQHLARLRHRNPHRRSPDLVVLPARRPRRRTGDPAVKITAEPRSDQWNADDFLGGPRSFTIAGVREGTADQKYDIELVEGEGRVWRPPLTMLRVLIQAWGDESKDWIGRRVTLYRDEKVHFGRDQVGGIRISHL